MLFEDQQTHAPSQAYRFQDNTKQVSAVINYFRDRFFNGDTTSSINQTLRDYDIYAAQFELSNQEKETFFVNVLEAPARDFFYHYSSQMSYNEIVSMMRDE